MKISYGVRRPLGPSRSSMARRAGAHVARDRAARFARFLGRARFLPHGHRTAHQVFRDSDRCICRDLRRFPHDDERTQPRSFSDPIRAAAVIYQVVKAGRLRHWVILGSDAHRRIGMKLDMLRTEYEEGKDIAFSTDYPDNSGRAVL